MSGLCTSSFQVVSVQESNKNPRRVLCITFGAPPSQPIAGQPVAASAAAEKTELCWNFLLTRSFGKTAKLADLLPAVLSMMPQSLTPVENWSQNITDIVDTLQAGDIKGLPAVLKELTAAGKGPLSYLIANAIRYEPLKAHRHQKLL